MAKKQFYPDRYHFTPAENRRFAWSNFTKLVHTNAHFEGGQDDPVTNANDHGRQERCR